MNRGGELPLGVILAGGRSSRMGRDKAWISFCGQPLFARVAGVLRNITGAFFVSGRNPADFGIDAPWLPDETPGLGPAGGVMTVLAATGRPCLVVSCDLPFLDTRTLERLVAHWRLRPSTALMTTYRIIESGYVESLVAVYDATGLPRMRQHLEQGQRRLSAIFPEEVRWHLDYSRGDADAARPFFNINAPPDLDRARNMEIRR